MNTTLARQALEALETALDTANEVATSIRIAQGGYINHKQYAADAEVTKIAAAPSPTAEQPVTIEPTEVKP